MGMTSKMNNNATGYTELKNDISKVYSTLTADMDDLRRMLEEEIPQVVVKTLKVGAGGIEIDPSARITWWQVDGAPDFVIEAELGAYATTGLLTSRMQNLLVNSDIQTVLGQNYIVTGMIAANRIAAGVITGCTLETASVTGKKVSLHDYNVEVYNGGERGVYIGYANGDSGTTYPSVMLQRGGGTSLITMLDNTNLYVFTAGNFNIPDATYSGGSKVLTTASTVRAKFA